MATVLDANSAVSPNIASGTFAGTTAALTVQIGFRPSWIIWYNQTDGDTINFWHNSSITNYLTVTTAAGTTTAAITTTDHGFTLPASDAVGNENGKTFVFIAGR